MLLAWKRILLPLAIAPGALLTGRALSAQIAEWGQAWLELAPEVKGEAPTRSGGTYLTVWQRETDGHWRIVRNLAF